jgi:hypothetical protein
VAARRSSSTEPTIAVLPERGHIIVRDLGIESREAFLARGHRERHFFAHRIVRLAKGGVDGLKLARRMCRPDIAPSQLQEIVLCALPPTVSEFPADVFFDDDLVWHQQQFGLPGHVATASVIVDGPDLYIPTLISDLVQRIGRRRELKTRIENRFKGWAHLLLNAVLGLALDRGSERIFIASAEWARQNTDPERLVQPALFERVYGGTLRPPFKPVHGSRWSMIDVRAHAEIVVRGPVSRIPLSDEPQVCVSHDIEHGWGHLDEPAVAARMQAEAPQHLNTMLELEAAAGVPATYCVLGFMLPGLAERIRGAGQCIAFHSYDHAASGEAGADAQLAQCRKVDYRIKGYRPARSLLTDELSDENLAFHNFEWLASSRRSLGIDRPALANGLVRIPILFDDFDLHRGAAYEPWRDKALAELGVHNLAVFSLHDCYANKWLHSYRDLLARVAELGRLRTLDQVAADVLLSRSF